MSNFSIRKIYRDLVYSKFLFLITWLSCFIILFLPEEYLNFLYLDIFLVNYGWIIGILFIVSSVILVMSFIRFIVSKFI